VEAKIAHQKLIDKNKQRSSGDTKAWQALKHQSEGRLEKPLWLALYQMAQLKPRGKYGKIMKKD
jgi:hypothetical protein